MGKKRKDVESSSSEDEACMEALMEATDQDFLKDSLYNKDKKDAKSDLTSSNENKTNDDKVNTESSRDYENHGLSQSCRDFIAKKLNERLEKEIVLDNEDTAECKLQNGLNEVSGIKLFSSSNTVITKIEDPAEPEIVYKKKKSKYNEKEHVKKCKQVAVDPEKIISQEETKSWTVRKIREPFKYKKLKNGTLTEIK